MSAVDLFATYPQYLAHILPVYEALPEERKGCIYVPSNFRPRLQHGRVRLSTPPSSDDLLLVAGYQDLRYANRRGKILAQHGASQVYAGVDSPSYDGGPGREQAGLFLGPNQQSVDRNLARYPSARGAVVGCPLLDAWTQIPAPGDGTIGVSFHWPCHLVTTDGENVPESGWAWPSWRDTIAELTKVRKVLGHGHPRARRELEAWWAELGVEAVWSPTELLARCDVLVIDNSSYGAEWSACGRPVVWLNDISWRRDVEHGGRFWEWPSGQIMCWPTDDLHAAIDRALYDPPDVRAAREQMVASIYGPIDGQASARAVEAILQWEADGCPHPREYARPKPCGC